MIWYIIGWYLVGLVAGVHAMATIRRELQKDYPKYFDKSYSLFQSYGDVFLVIMIGAIGPIGFLVTAVTFPRSFFK